MKFKNELDKCSFILEMNQKVDNLDGWEPTDDLVELFFKRRKELSTKLKSFRRSQDTKENWRSNRYKIMKGIKGFHNSTAGKQHHRSMARFLANRDSGLFSNPYKSNEALKALSSLETHLYIERDYYCGLHEGVDKEILIEEAIPVISRAKENLFNGHAILDEDTEFLIRLTETAAMVSALASESGKSVQEVEKLWDKAKGLVKKEYNKSEDDDGFYSLVVGILKKMLGLS